MFSTEEANAEGKGLRALSQVPQRKEKSAIAIRRQKKKTPGATEG